MGEGDEGWDEKKLENREVNIFESKASFDTSKVGEENGNHTSVTGTRPRGFFQGCIQMIASKPDKRADKRRKSEG